ncbi:MAG: hypothetical protein RJA87_1671 [Pseudomonadota bacterium]|jgi:hypothetical protein
MNDLIRIALLVGATGVAVTAAASLLARQGNETRRLSRIIHRVLDGEPDDQIIAKGRNAALAIRMEPPQVLVLADGGAKARLYGLHLLIGAELEVDGRVVARAYRGEARRALDQVAADAQEVHLRLIFDDPRHPEFILELWTEGDETRRDATNPASEIREARRWLARVEALLRHQPMPTTGSTILAPPRPERSPRQIPPDLEEPPYDDDEPDQGEWREGQDEYGEDDPDDVPWKS